jgi:hypothetical protein
MLRLADPSILSAIRRNLVRLDLLVSSKEVVEGIVEHCQNLQYLKLGFKNEDETEALVEELKNGLKKLSILMVNGKSIRLGTDWEGYPESL